MRAPTARSLLALTCALSLATTAQGQKLYADLTRVDLADHAVYARLQFEK